jgi:multisite-specific tRNA:(cytosine-C5)-methyltransferase
VLQRLKNHYVPHIKEILFDGQPVDPPVPLPWYPNELGWQMTTPKTIIRRHEPFAEFQRFLVSETTVGNISRQEAVSMIPPLVMDIKPGMTVLDMCAAPGSKTAQLIEMVHGGEEARIRKIIRDIRRNDGREISPDDEETKIDIEEEKENGDWSDDGRSTGLVIANDVEYRRAHLLIHQAKRLNSPNLIVMNHDATHFPSIKIGVDRHNNGVEANRYLKFDRILADVPCTGDGTARKNYGIWKDWVPTNAFGLHPVQTRILVRALQMLKVGGKVVYSTCSMHAVENEAVIASAIDRCGGLAKVEIVDSSSMLPGLKRSPGLKTWKVMDKAGRMWDSWESVMKHRDQHGVESLGKLAHTMFSDYMDEELPLERCMRVYPHQQDTGGFFITVLQKKAEIKARPENQAKPGHAKETAEDLQVEAELAKDDDGGKPKSSIAAIVDEIETSKPTKADPLPHITTIDAVESPTVGDTAVNENSVVALQPRIDEETKQFATVEKRAATEVSDASRNVKRLRVHEENGHTAQVGDEIESLREEEQLEHWPPPPASRFDRPVLDDEQSGGLGRKTQGQFFEEPFKYLPADQPELETIYKFYGLHPRFPRDRFMVRNAIGSPTKAIYYTSELARTILEENEGKGYKFVHCGIKAFVKQDVPREDVCRWRIQNESMSLIEPWVSEERVVRLHSRKVFYKLLINMFPKLSEGGWKDLGEVGIRLRDSSLGCFVLRIEPGEGEDSFG